VFLHDLKGKGAYISAMVNGFRYFHYTAANDSSGSDFPASQSISVDSIKKQPADT